MKRYISYLIALMFSLNILLTGYSAFASASDDIRTWEQNVARDPLNTSNYTSLAYAYSTAGEVGVKVYLDGNKVDLTQSYNASAEYMYRDGTIYLPLRSLAERLGGTIDFNTSTNIATIYVNGNTFIINCINDEAYSTDIKINGVQTDLPRIGIKWPFLHNWRLYVPVEFVNKYMVKKFAGWTGNSNLSVVYILNNPVPVQIITLNNPRISPNGGAYNRNSQVTVSMGVENADYIYYTLNGGEPNENSTRIQNFSSINITLAQDTTLRARAYKNGTFSGTSVAVFTVNTRVPSAPTFNLVSGQNYNGPQELRIYAESGTNIYYTLDGNEPNGGSIIYSSPVMINQTTTVKAKAYNPVDNTWSATSSITVVILNQVDAPVLSPAGGTYPGPIDVYINNTNNYEIRYTIDNSEPTRYSILYSGPIRVDRTMTIKVKAYRNGSESTTVVGNYYININNSINMPMIVPPPGSYNNPVDVTIYTNDGGEIRYTTDNSEPSYYSSVFTTPIRVDRNMTIKAKVFKNGQQSQTLYASYTINGGGSQDITVIIANAKALCDQGRYDEAISMLLRLMETCKDSQDAIIMLADCYAAKGDLNTAKTKLREFIYLYEYPRVVNKYAEILIRMGEYNEARNVLEQILPKYSTEIYLYKTLIMAYAKLGHNGIKVYVYGREVDFTRYDNVRPYISEGRTLIPIRALSETLGAQVDWDYYLRTATIYLDGKTIVLKDKSKVAKVDGEPVALDVAAHIKGERLMVPIRFVSETYGRKVDWYSLENIVNIVSVTR